MMFVYVVFRTMVNLFERMTSPLKKSVFGNLTLRLKHILPYQMYQLHALTNAYEKFAHIAQVSLTIEAVAYQQVTEQLIHDYWLAVIEAY